jgi:hypothetical protein
VPRLGRPYYADVDYDVNAHLNFTRAKIFEIGS